ncbi:hypothetical protein H6G94_34050 [Nostoc punctiforme FACHB-252]|uniref:Uncharacterized protein n=1 Tax=Nostoc punctiforme FACHB-252 TaxID=1357509 RepID=A0ABR8HK23_NOSPU|nr:hypothetical protein [Nostoc punctiforme]MBD2616211.1 hypothetical protein [Nostoc punctiforme FACHB-252]
MSTAIAQRRIESFNRHFGKEVLILAYHAAFPIALTPDLLYRLWSNFKQDIHGNALNIPWVSVANLLLSTLVNEVGYELYEMDVTVRSQLLKRLKNDSRFGQNRIKELSYFLQAYVKQKLESNDPYERDFAQVQQWTALAYVEPNQAARELASELTKVYNEQKQDKYELIRLASVIETLTEPLEGYEPLLVYSRGMLNWVFDNKDLAITEFKNLPRIKRQSQLQEFILSIPQRQKPAATELKFEDFILKNLHKYKEYSDNLLRGLKSLELYQPSANEILDNRQLQNCLNSLKDAANKTVELATSPVKIAVLEKFSGGKTLLVGSLKSYADALPVSKIPTTDNITAIHLLQQDGLKTTQFDDFTVEYLDSLKQLYEDTRSAADKLRQQQDILKHILSDLSISSEESPALKKLRVAIDKIYSTYNRFKDNLGKQPLKDARGVAISDVIKDEVTYRILEWKQWNLLFNRMQNGRIVLLPVTESKTEPFARRNQPNVNIPTKSDDFYAVFESTFIELKYFAKYCIQEASNHLLHNLSNQLTTEIEYLKAKLREEMETEIKETFGEEEAYIFYIVYQGYNPEKWQEIEIMKQPFQEENYIETLTVFPLAHQDEKHEIGQIYDWASEYKQYSSVSAQNHLPQILRLRDKLITSLILHLSDYASQINKKVDKAILEILNSLTPELNTLLRKEALLRYIASEKLETKEADSVLPIFSQIASIPTPEIASLANID